ncbi:Neprilysin-1 [Aphelenchoides bicaudatus]|nr:Neprilysin-1 [Aphelenchoides bicaudatus]
MPSNAIKTLPLVLAVLTVIDAKLNISTVSDASKKWKYPEISLNYSVDPCEDLYEHVCSNWKHSHPVPPDRTAYSKLTQAAEQIKPVLFGKYSNQSGNFKTQTLELYMKPAASKSKAINELKQYFRACNDADAINALKSDEYRAEIDAIGGWPLLLGSKWNSTSFDLTQLLIDIARPRGYKIYVDFAAAHDLRNASRWLLNFDQRQLVMETKEYYLNSTYKAKLDAYRQYMTDVLSLMIQDSQSNCTKEELNESVDELIKFDIELAKLAKSKEQRYDFDRLYNLRRLNDLNDLAPSINWTRYLIEISPPELYDYIANNPQIVINEVEYIQEISRLLNKTKPSIIVNYALWRLTHVSIISLDTRFQTCSTNDFWAKKNAKNAGKSVSYKQLKTWTRHPALSMCREKFKREDFVVAKTMVEELREAFIRTFKKNQWISPKIKNYALKKARKMLQIVGGPELLYNDTLLDAYYKDLSLNKNDSFAKQEQKVLQFEHSRRMKNLLKSPDRDEMEISAALVNAYNEQTNNKIIIPAAILQEPFFHRNYPKLAIYAGVGAIIGHEMGHSFDGQGRQFDMRGNLFNWWDNSTLLLFTDRAKCIANQYSKYKIEDADTDLHINGQLTRDENLADLVGLKHSYWAYHAHLERTKTKPEEQEFPGFKNYTSEQMFFISYANILCTSATKQQAVASALTDPHSPANWRINGVLSNMPQFAKAFNCRKDAALNPANRCVVW